jgi:hypothetical protein
MDDLAERLWGILKSTSLSDPRDIAAELKKGVTQKQRNEYFAESLPKFVSDRMTRARSRAVMEPAKNVPGAATVSRAQAISTFWLDMPAPGVSAWKPLREFTAEDHRHAADKRIRFAKTVVAWGDWHSRCANEMEAAGVSQFGDLPNVEKLGEMRPT